MILEVATLTVRPDQSAAFDQAFAQARPIISSMQGYVSHQLQRCVETPGKYLLFVNWRSIEDHTTGFRQSPGYQQWRQLLYGFYESPPAVQHYEKVLEGSVQTA